MLNINRKNLLYSLKNLCKIKIVKNYLINRIKKIKKNK